jgi:aspartate carbamoyltransferase catalytic subunit
MKLQHVLQSQQFPVPMLMELFTRARHMRNVLQRGGTKDYDRKVMATLFYKPSTRTRFSFESAMRRLGGGVLSTESATEFSSEVKGEQLEDTIRIISAYCDVIVLRHHKEGGAQRAADVSPIPIINAGDGEGGQHPSLALSELFTIYSECKKLDGLSVAFIGALDSGRTARSLAYLLGKFQRVKLYFLAPQKMQMKTDILDYLERHNVWYELSSKIEDAIPHVDVVYQTRIDRTRLGKEEVDLSQYNIGPSVLERMRKDAIILHPLPRSVEIDPIVDRDPRAAYFRQATSGLVVRMALLSLIFDAQS